jgi:membrane-associated phospholipid phosphatase
MIYVVFTYLITIQLKTFIREPRPQGYNSELYREWMYALDYEGVEQYGMPSGHSMIIFFSLFYLWWIKKNVWYMIGGSFLAVLTLYQRFKYKKHTLSQLVVGAILGFTLSYLAYIITTTWFSKMNCIGSYAKSPDNV